MNRPECQLENSFNSRFCSKCATSLSASEEISVSHTKTIKISTKELARISTFAGRYEVM